MKIVAIAFGAASAVYAAVFMVLYLYRWEWQRALISGVLLLVIQGFLVCLLLLSRLSRLERRLAESDARVREVRRRLEQSRELTGAPGAPGAPGAAGPASAPGRFRWLDSWEPHGGGRTFVFVPVLVVAGAALSGVAFAIQKIASATFRPAAEQRLAGRLSALTAPTDPVPGRGRAADHGGADHGDVLGGAWRAARLEDRPPVPPARAGWKLAVLALAAAAAAMAPLMWDALADSTQTRRERPAGAAATTVVFRIEMRGEETPAARQIAAEDLWQSCRRSTFVENERAPLQRLESGIYAGTIRPALTPHDLMRLRGCIEDASANRATASVLGEGQAEPRG